MNATTSVPTRKATAKTSPSTSDKAASPIENEATWRTASVRARDAVSELVFNARAIDEEERDDPCGKAKRLMALVISDLGETSADAKKEDFECAFFNAQALIQGALGMPDDPVGPRATANLHHALTIIDGVTDVLCGGFGIEKVMAAVASEPPPVVQAEKPAERLNMKQAERVLETVASRALTLYQLMMILQTNEFDSEFSREVLVNAACDLACSIGAISDGALDGFIHGDADHWNHGPLFATAGKAVHA